MLTPEINCWIIENIVLVFDLITVLMNNQITPQYCTMSYLNVECELHP